MSNIVLYDPKGSDQVPKLEHLRSALLGLLRPCDVATLLPGAHLSPESQQIKNVVFDIDGNEPNVPYQLLNPDFGHGIAVIRLPKEAAESLFASQEAREHSLKKLSESCLNLLAENPSTKDVHIGPMLSSSSSRDVEGDVWQAGFDSSNCAVGLYTSIETAVPVGCTEGCAYPVTTYYLVAKAGSGRAGQELSSKLMANIAKGTSLNGIFRNGEVTMGELTRVYQAGRRNRARIILQAAEKLGIAMDIETSTDHTSCEEAQGQQVSILLVDSMTNVLECVLPSMSINDVTVTDPEHDEAQWRYYAGCISPHRSQGLGCCSTASEGMTLFFDPVDEASVCSSQYVAHPVLPFGSSRVYGNVETLLQSATTMATPDLENPDSALKKHANDAWIRSHFTWPQNHLRLKTDEVTRAIVESLVPAVLLGTHTRLDHASFVHTLSIGRMRTVSLYPELVYLAGTEYARIRPVAAHIAGLIKGRKD